jgi:protein-disulfide isomerase
MPRRSIQIFVAFALLGCSGSKGAAAPRAADAATVRPAASGAAAVDSTSTVLAKADAGRITGSASAPVWLIIVSDFQCPYCKRWHDEVWEVLRKEYVDNGKIRVAYVNLPLPMHRNAWPAAHAAMCASVQGKFWPMQDGLFRTQKEWGEAANPEFTFDVLAKEAGANVEALHACVKSNAMQAIIQGDADRASNAGVQSTPTFFVGGKPVIGAQPLSAFREAIDAALAAKPAGK